MLDKGMLEGLIEILGKENVERDVPMSEHTSFKTGGPADFMLKPQNAEQLLRALTLLRQSDTETHLIGNGTNLLVRDGGIRGAVIRLGKDFEGLTVEGDVLTAGAGVRLYALTRFALSNGLTGLEFASGIPGTVGGGLYMNAGAYGPELKDFVLSTRILDEELCVRELTVSEMGLGYRSSVFQAMRYIILDARFRLLRGDVSAAREQVKTLNARRREKQPLEYPSAGSTFKRPQGHFAGTLIEQAGLKGATFGGAQVSEKHSGFIINLGNATSSDIIALIGLVRGKVYETSGILLEPEVQIIGADA